MLLEKETPTNQPQNQHTTETSIYQELITFESISLLWLSVLRQRGSKVTKVYSIGITFTLVKRDLWILHPCLVLSYIQRGEDFQTTHSRPIQAVTLHPLLMAGPNLHQLIVLSPSLWVCKCYRIHMVMNKYCLKKWLNSSLFRTGISDKNNTCWPEMLQIWHHFPSHDFDQTASMKVNAMTMVLWILDMSSQIIW